MFCLLCLREMLMLSYAKPEATFSSYNLVEDLLLQGIGMMLIERNLRRPSRLMSLCLKAKHTNNERLHESCLCPDRRYYWQWKDNMKLGNATAHRRKFETEVKALHLGDDWQDPIERKLKAPNRSNSVWIIQRHCSCFNYQWWGLHGWIAALAVPF